MTHSTPDELWNEPGLKSKRARVRDGESQRRRQFSIKHRIAFDPEAVSYEQITSELYKVVGTFSDVLQSFDWPDEQKRTLATKFFDDVHDLRGSVWESVCHAIKYEQHYTTHINELSIGSVKYALRSVREVVVEPGSDGTWRYTVAGFHPSLNGIGSTINSARDAFLQNVHVTFQSLVTLRPFRMSEAQRSIWSNLSANIDCDAYWRSVPLKLQEIGHIEEQGNQITRIRWAATDLHEQVNWGIAPPEIAKFPVGTWITAVTERDPITYILRRVVFASPRSPVTPIEDSRFASWIDSLPKGDDLTPSVHSEQ